jgi:hypothetical protein
MNQISSFSFKKFEINNFDQTLKWFIFYFFNSSNEMKFSWQNENKSQKSFEDELFEYTFLFRYVQEEFPWNNWCRYLLYVLN